MDQVDEKKGNVHASIETLNNSSESDNLLRLVSRPTLWPEGPEQLGKAKAGQWTTILYDIVLVCTPLALIVKTVLCIVAHHNDQDNVGDQVDQTSSLTLGLIQFNAQLTTLFTIIFISIVSTLVRRMALWRAQQGAAVAELEQWHASVSLTGTLKTIWTLRMWTVMSLGLVVIWSWYYLGSQASTREYRFRECGNAHKMNVTVTNTSGPSVLDDPYFSALSNSQKAQTNAKFFAVTDADRFEKGYDQIGRMLIPFEKQSKYSNLDRHGYLDIIASKTEYTSRIGLRVYAVFPNLERRNRSMLTSNLIGDLTLSTSYLNVNCTPVRVRNTTEFPEGVLPFMSHSLNLTTAGDPAKNIPASFDVWYRNGNTNAGVRAISSNCKVTTVSLEIQATCNPQGCAAKKIKALPTADSVIYATPFNNVTLASRFFSELLLSTGTPSNQTDLSVVENLLALPNQTIDNKTANMDFVSEVDILQALASPSNISAAALARNLSTSQTQQWLEGLMTELVTTRSRVYMTPMINTYLTVWQQERTYDILSDEYDGAEPIHILNGSVASPWLTVAQLDGSYWEPQYAISWPWIVIDFMSCGVLLVAAILAAFLRTRILAPDIFGYVSSMTRDNPHIHLPPTASTLDGMTRARLLKKIKVQFADIPYDAETGKVCLVQTEGPGCQPVTKLSSTRQYV